VKGEVRGEDGGIRKGSMDLEGGSFIWGFLRGDFGEELGGLI
jgi:hypothetical protein